MHVYGIDVTIIVLFMLNVVLPVVILFMMNAVLEEIGIIRYNTQCHFSISICNNSTDIKYHVMLV